jgi:hypothetical protein
MLKDLKSKAKDGVLWTSGRGSVFSPSLLTGSANRNNPDVSS